MTVLGLPVDLLQRSEIVNRLGSSIRERSLIHVVTLNPEQIMAARRDHNLAGIINRSDLITIDGVGLEAALRIGGFRPVERVTGVELVEMIADLTIPVYLLGGRPGAAEDSAKRLMDRFPNCQISGSWSGGTPEQFDDATSIKKISESGCLAVMVAYGAPAQLRWIERNRDALEQTGVRIAIGVGGALDYLSGQVPRPPAFVQNLGLEWLFRLAIQPDRWRRQLVLPAFAFLAGLEGIRRRLSAS